MPTPFTSNDSTFKRSHKPSFTQSDLVTEDSFTSNFNSLPLDDNYSSNPSLILKENYSSINSNNVTFGDFLYPPSNKKYKQNNLAFAISDKFPPKIKKQVQAIIEYYETQLEGQRQMYWKVTETRKIKKNQPQEEFTLQDSRLDSMAEKDERINELENRVMEKDEKISELNKQITILMTKNAKLKKQLGGSPLKSSRALSRGDSIREVQ